MECLPRKVAEDEVDQEITQRDQFNTDEFPIAETLVREATQNTLDARSNKCKGPVRIRIRLVQPSPQHKSYWKNLLAPLQVHLAASKLNLNGVDFAQPTILVVEDFYTTGLLGAWDKKDKLDFSDFWRRFGVSHKGGKAAGRWGLGKLVFSIASDTGVFFGLTVRHDDPQRQRLLMGQAILNNHKIGKDNFAPHIFFGRKGKSGIQVPEIDTAAVEKFAIAAGLTRKKEPGLSIAIIGAREGLTPDQLLPHVLINYFFPILTGQLVAELGSITVDEKSFEKLAKKYGGAQFSDGRVATFIRTLNDAMDKPPKATLASVWDKIGDGNGVRQALNESTTSAVRAAFGAGKLVSVRAPLELRRKDGTLLSTYVDAYLQKIDKSGVSQAFYVRGSITIPGEARGFRARNSFGALIAQDAAVAEFLGDAENPSHTRWNASGDKLTKNWQAYGSKVAAIRRLLNEFYELVSDSASEIDEEMLVDIFSIPAPEASKKKKPKAPAPAPSTVPVLPVSPKNYRIDRIPGGFAVRGNLGSERKLPYEIDVRVAYAVQRGDAFRRFKRYDFDVGTSPIAMKADGVNWSVAGPNLLSIEVLKRNFDFEVTGFDGERDLEVRVE
jgi:hypothetical protein